MRRASPIGLALVVLLSWVGGARAQLPEPPARPSAEDVARAREIFIRGVGHAEAEAWAPAARDFLQSYRLSGSPVALLNAGTSLARQGRHRDATEALLRVLHDPSFDDPTRDALERALQGSSAHVAIVTLHGLPDEGVRWALDRTDRGPPTRQPLVIVLEPGAHHIAVTQPGLAPWVYEAPLQAGARVERNVVFAPEVETVEPGGDEAWPWILVGVLGALAVGGIVAAVALDAEAQLQPRSPFVIELP